MTKNILRKSNAYPFVGILRSCQHVVYDAVHVGNKTIHANFEQHDNCPTYILSHFWIIVIGQEEKVTDKVIDMRHESLRPPNDKLIDASNRMTPDLRAGVFEKLQELWN